MHIACTKIYSLLDVDFLQRISERHQNPLEWVQSLVAAERAAMSCSINIIDMLPIRRWLGAHHEMIPSQRSWKPTAVLVLYLPSRIRWYLVKRHRQCASKEKRAENLGEVKDKQMDPKQISLPLA